MLVRPADVGDLERVKAVRHAAFTAHAPSAYSPQEVLNLLADLDGDELLDMVNERQLFVAEVHGNVVGCAGWRGEMLRHVYVSPESGRSGIGHPPGGSCGD